jgi:hypothetical protein
MAYPVSFTSASWKDYSKEVSHERLALVNLTAANIVAQTTLINALWTTAAALTLGNQFQQDILLSKTPIGLPTPATSPLAQRENKWLLRYHDANAKNFTSEMPCADLTLLATNSDDIDTSGGAYIAFKTAFEAVVRSPDDLSAVTLDGATFVGRRL